MDDLISRQEAIEACLKYNGVGWVWSQILDEIEKLPSAERHGLWIEENRNPRSWSFYCSVCHQIAYDVQPTRINGWVKRCRYAWCPNCGARMRGET